MKGLAWFCALMKPMGLKWKRYEDVACCTSGNPNCGKTTVFNALTGSRKRVGNWPGVTVERMVGEYDHCGATIEVTDLPGIYSFSALSPDEIIARNIFYLISLM